MLWKSSKNSVVQLVGSTAGTKCQAITKKKGTATVTATALDGSGKSAKVKITVTDYIDDRTPAPTPTPDPRTVTVIEDFEKYDVGTAWSRFTAGGYANSGSMTVVEDPEDPKNKCLKVSFNGADQAFDYAPVFGIDISALTDSKGVPAAGKKLGDYSGIRLDARTVSNDPSSVQYKKIFCYFDQAGNIKAEDFFATSNNEESTAHVADPKLRFGVNIPMAEGDDKENGCVLHNGASSKESNKYFPFAYSSWVVSNAATHFAQDSCTTGFKDAEGEPNVGFATRNLTFMTDRIREADSTLLAQDKLDMVIGSTYDGGSKYADNGIIVTLYLDNIALVEDDIALESIDLGTSAIELTRGSSTTLNVSYTPSNTTHKEMVYTSDNGDVAKVDASGKITGIAEGTAVITATPKDYPALAKSVTVTVVKVAAQSSDYDVLKQASIVPKAPEGANVPVSSETDSEFLEDGTLKISYSALNQSVFLDLGGEMDLRGYQGVEITGQVPGQMSLELYDGSLDKVANPDDWYEKYAGYTYPFYKASCAWRFEEGAFNVYRSLEAGLAASNGTTPLASEETQRFSWNQLTGTKGSGDYSRIRYICLKTNQPPVAQEAGGANRWPGADPYLIRSLKFVTGQVNGDILGYSKNALSDKNEAGKADIAYTKDENGVVTAVKFNAEDAAASWYLDILDGEIKTEANRNSEFDLNEFTYIKVVAGDDVAQLDVKLAGKDVTFDDALPVGSDTGSGARTVYFPLEPLKAEGAEALAALDTVQICAHGGTLTRVTAVTGLPRLEPGTYPNQYILEPDGTKRELTDREDNQILN